MAGTFNLNEFLTDVSKSAAKGAKPQTTSGRTADNIMKLSVYDLVPSDDNFYSMNDIEELKSKIELAGKVLQNLVVISTGNGKYKVISGHRRRLASISLVQEGKPEYEFVPCIIETNESDAEVQAIREEIMLIAANSQREKTAWDKIEEARRTRAILEKIKKQEKVPGGLRDLVAKALHTSPAQIGRYDAIIKSLCPEFVEELKRDRINISTAYELSGLSPENQQSAFAEYRIDGRVSIDDAKKKKRAVTNKVNPENPPPQEAPLLGQMDFDGNAYEEGKPKVEPLIQEESRERETDVVLDQHSFIPGSIEEKTDETPQPPAEPTLPQTEAVQNPELTYLIKQNSREEAVTVERLKSLREYCIEQENKDSDHGPRVWMHDIEALEVAILTLSRG